MDIQLPKEFETWNKFWLKIKSSDGWQESHVRISYNGVEFDARKIKAKCFDELMAIIPSREQLWKFYEFCGNGYGIDYDNSEWLYKLSHLL